LHHSFESLSTGSCHFFLDSRHDHCIFHTEATCSSKRRLSKDRHGQLEQHYVTMYSSSTFILADGTCT
jgi:hypothetical protein